MTKERFEPFQTKENTYKLRHGNVWATILMSEELMNTVEPQALEQLRKAMEAPGVESVTVSPDFHFGYSVPIGVTIASSTHLYPSTVGNDAACSVSLSKLGTEIRSLEKPAKRELIEAIEKQVGVGEQRRSHGMDRSEFFEILAGVHRPEKSWINSIDHLPDGPLAQKALDIVAQTLNDRMLQHLGTLGGGKLTASPAR